MKLWLKEKRKCRKRLWMHKGNRPALTLAWLVPYPLPPFAEPLLPWWFSFPPPWGDSSPAYQAWEPARWVGEGRFGALPRRHLLPRSQAYRLAVSRALEPHLTTWSTDRAAVFENSANLAWFQAPTTVLWFLSCVFFFNPPLLFSRYPPPPASPLHLQLREAIISTPGERRKQGTPALASSPMICDFRLPLNRGLGIGRRQRRSPFLGPLISSLFSSLSE